MGSSSISLVIIMVLLILMSAYFSATETAFSSLNRIRLKNLANSGNKRAVQTLALAEDYDRVLSTILIGNNIVNIALASLATVFFVGHFGDAGITISTIAITVLVLIFGEISPKSLAKEAPESYAMFSTPILRILILILTPVNFLFMQWKNLLSRIFKFRDSRSISEEELITLVEEAEQDGGIGAQESELIRSAIEFNELRVSDILTPRVDIHAITETEDKEKVALKFRHTEFSRLPVFRDTIDNIIGVINQKDFHNHVMNDECPLDGIVKPVIYVSNSMKIYKLLKLLQQTKSHIAVVTDEYGGTLGIVTLEDILEELVGEIWDEHDEVINEFERLSDNEYRISCSANLDKMFDLFDIKHEIDITTVSGWVTHELGKIPDEGDHFTFENLTVTVTKTDYRRVIEILVTIN